MSQAYAGTYGIVNKQKDNQSRLIVEEPSQGEEDEEFKVMPLEENINESMFLSEFNEHMYRYKRQHKNSCRFFVHGKYFDYSEESLFIFGNDSKFRYRIVKIITSPYFDRFIISLILVYSILLGMKCYDVTIDELERESMFANKLLKQIDPYFNVIIYTEFVLKVIAMGFILGGNGYMADGWNWIDFTVVASSFSDLVMSAFLGRSGGGQALAALRAFRLLRPLKLLTSIPELKKLLRTLLASIQSLGGIMGLALFFFTIFSILGVAIWSGKIHYRCYMTEEPVDGKWELWSDGDRTYDNLCSPIAPRNETCPYGGYCGSRYEQFNEDGSRYVFTDYPDNLGADTAYEEFNYGLTNFDNIGSAFMTIFIVTTMDGWTKIMNITQEFASKLFVHFFFISCVWICAFFVLNLTIASMLMQYDKEDQANDAKEVDRFELELKDGVNEIFVKGVVEIWKKQGRHEEAREVVEKIPILEKLLVEDEKVQADEGVKKYLRQEQTFQEKFFARKDLFKELKLDEKDPYYQKFLVKKAMSLASHPLFDSLIMFVIILNTIVLSMDKYPAYDPQVLKVFKVLNQLFTIIFTFEVVVKMTALGIKPFMSEGFNVFDLLIVIASLTQIVITYVNPDGSNNSGVFLILRTFRVFRIFKLFKQGDMRMLLNSIIFTISTIGPYVVFLFFFMYIFALVGMSFYSGKIKIDDDDKVVEVYEDGTLASEGGSSPRENFDTLGNSFLTIFICFISAGWSDIMFTVIRCTSNMSALYFILLIIIGGIILMNLFLAIMLGNFDKSKSFGQKKKILEAYQQLLIDKKEAKYSLFEANQMIFGDQAQYVNEDVLKIKKPKAHLNMAKLGHIFQAQGPQTLLKGNSKGKKSQGSVQFDQSYAKNQLYAGSNQNYDPDDPLGAEEKSEDFNFDEWSDISELIRHDSFFTNSSCFIFHIDSSLRRFCLTLAEPRVNVNEVFRIRDRIPDKDINIPLLQDKDEDFRGMDQQELKTYDRRNKWFDNIILVLILISSAMLPLDNPLNDPNAHSTKLIAKINIFFTLCFLTEATIKIIAKGFFFNNLGEQVKPYMDSGWNRVDAFVVFISTLDLIMTLMNVGSNLAALKALRALRALRPLRVIKKFDNLKLIINTLFKTLGAMQNVMMVSILFLLIFAIMGVSFFKGQLYSCQGAQAPYMNGSEGEEGQVVVGDEIENQIVVTKWDCLASGGQWENSLSNFDNTKDAMSTLFQMMTTEGWQDQMYLGIDSVGVDLQPIKNNRIGLVFFFCGYMIIGGLFIMNLFVGVVIDNFNKIKEQNESGGSMYITESQKEWIQVQKMGQSLQLRKILTLPDGIRKKVFELVTHSYFESFIMLNVVLNTVTMSCKYYQMPANEEKFLKEANLYFSMVFNLEMLLKLFAMHGNYFDSGWNLFDMFIVINADIGIVLSFMGLEKSAATAVTILRAFRILRIVKMLQKVASIRVIIMTVISILPSVSNIMALFTLVLFIYACVGINLFSGTRRNEDIDKYNNFQTFPNAMVILMRFSTGEDWNVYMYDYGNVEDCSSDQTYEDIFGADGKGRNFQGCGSSFAYAYFISFQIVMSMLMLNLAIAAVIDGFTVAQADEDNLFKEEDHAQLLDVWAKYDPNGEGKLSLTDLRFFLCEIQEPFGYEQGLQRKIVKDCEASYYINDEENYMVRKLDLMKNLKFMKLKPIIGEEMSMHSDHVYISFVDVFKALTQRAFSNKGAKFEVMNQKIRKQLDRGWDERSKKVKAENDKLNKKQKSKAEKMKNIFTNKIAVSIIEGWVKESSTQNKFKKIKKLRAERQKKLEEQNQS